MRLFTIAGFAFLTYISTQVEQCPKPVPPLPPKNDAALEAVLTVNPIEAEQKYPVQVTAKNVGTKSWLPGKHKLGSQNPMDNTDWGISRVDLQKEVKPGESYTFAFEISRAQVGTYEACFQMLEELVEHYGNISCTTLSVISTQKWAKIIKDAGLENFHGAAPFRGRYLGDTWSEWIESPHSLKEFQRFTNITELGVYIGFEDRWRKFLEGKEAIEEAVKHQGPTFGQKTINLWESLKIAEAAGLPILLTLSYESSFWPQNYHNEKICRDKGWLMCAPYTRPGEIQNVKKVVSALLNYINSNFKDVVKYIWHGNESCYLSFDTKQYSSVVNQITPIIRNEMPGAKIGVDGDCENVSADGVDAVGFHFAIPNDPTETLRQKVIDRTKQFKSRYRKEIWMDEFGIGRKYDQFSKEGAARYDIMRDFYNTGGMGVTFLSIGGNYKRSECNQECLYTTDQGEATKSIEAIKEIARKYNIAW